VPTATAFRSKKQLMRSMCPDRSLSTIGRVGRIVGLAVVGLAVGLAVVGALVGTSTFSVGRAVGEVIGAAVGPSVGEAVAVVGPSVVSDPMGDPVGALDGALVGSSWGASRPPCPPCFTLLGVRAASIPPSVLVAGTTSGVNDPLAAGATPSALRCSSNISAKLVAPASVSTFVMAE
jgi:hypothetical protein